MADDLRRFVTASRWVTGFVISQAPSRGVVADGDPQRLNWDFSLDAEASRQIRDLIAARTPAPHNELDRAVKGKHEQRIHHRRP